MEQYNNILNFYKEYIKLEQIIRKGWLMRSVPAKRLESVGDHTLQLMMLASVLTKEFGITIDTNRLMEMLLVHDLGEVVIGDISEVEENHNLKNVKEAEAVKKLLDNLSKESANYYYGLWNEMENQNTEMAHFAYLLDKIDAVIKADIYEEQFDLDGLFEEFYEFQKAKGTFNNSILEDFYLYINSRHKNNKKIIHKQN